MPSIPVIEYNEHDLHELMNCVGEWARDWDDVLRYLEGPREPAVAIPADRIPAIIRDVSWLQQHARYTRDYRKIWQRLTGIAGDELAPPSRTDPHAVDPFEIQADYLGDLEFPADKRQLIRTARLNGAPGRVMERIEALTNAEYRDRDELLEEMNDADWRPAQQPERT